MLHLVTALRSSLGSVGVMGAASASPAELGMRSLGGCMPRDGDGERRRRRRRRRGEGAWEQIAPEQDGSEIKCGRNMGLRAKNGAQEEFHVSQEHAYLMPIEPFIFGRWGVGGEGILSIVRRIKYVRRHRVADCRLGRI